MSESAEERMTRILYRVCPEERDAVAKLIRAAESAARAEGYASGLREGQERMRERIENMPMPEKDWIGSLYEKGWKGGWRAYSAAINALEVEDG